PGERAMHAREGAPGGKAGPILSTSVPFPSQSCRFARPGMTTVAVFACTHDDVLLVGFQKPPHDGSAQIFQRNAPAQRLQLVVTRIPARIRHTPAGCTTTARGRSPGSRVVTVARLPRAARLKWHVDESSPVTVAGAAAA